MEELVVAALNGIFMSNDLIAGRWACMQSRFILTSTEAVSVSRRIAMGQVADSRHGHSQEM